MKTITENTMISLAVVLTLLGGAGYVGYNASVINASAAQIQELRAKVSLLEEMKTDVAVIRAKLEDIDRKISKKGN